jgi:hypothetical protein
LSSSTENSAVDKLRKTFDTTDESSDDLPFWGPTAIRMDA